MIDKLIELFDRDDPENPIGVLYKQLSEGGYAQAVAARLPGALKTLMAATTITGSGAVNHTPVTGLDIFMMATLLLTLSSKTMDASTTLDIYLQFSPDGGVSWDDLYHWPQITSAAIADGKYITFVFPQAVTAQPFYHIIADGALAADTNRNVSWCDRVRIKTVAANFAGTDTITAAMSGYFQ